MSHDAERETYCLNCATPLEGPYCHACGQKTGAAHLDLHHVTHAPAAHPAFAPRDEYRATPITDLLRFEQADFSNLFRKSAVKRAKLSGMLRNVEALTGEHVRGKVTS